MKKLSTSVFLLCLCVGSLMAQSSLYSHKSLKPAKYETRTKQIAKTGFEQNTNEVSVPPSYMASASRIESQIGHTFYDLQTNSSMPRRLVAHSDGHLSASFTFSPDATYAIRGTGYNSSDASQAWGTEPTAGIETVRTGFGNLVSLANGTEVSVAHPASGGPVVARKAAGASTWSQATLPSPAPCLWFRAATDGNYIHIIGITIPVANAGTVYKGVDGHMLYWRSADGGATWDKQGTVIPGLDSTLFTSLGGDGYAIDAQDGKVAFAIFNDWNDSVVFTSEDNGGTWSKSVFWDFPLDNYIPDTGYGVNDIPSDPNAPDTLAIRTTDESGSLIIDDAGIVHIAFGTRYVTDIDLGDGSTSIYSPVTDLIYGNSLDWEALSVVGYPLDLNGNDTLDMSSTTYEWYNGRCTESYPMFTIDDQSQIQLLYAGTREGTADQAGFMFRHIYRVISPDLGTTWTEPQDLIDENSVGDQILADLTEAVYPSAPRRVGNELCLSYQADYDAGIGVQDDHADVDNQIKCFCVSTTKTENVAPESFKFVINPNPADQGANIAFVLDRTANANVEIVNLMGQTVRRTTTTSYGSGAQQIGVNTSDLANGLYLVRLNIGEKTSTRKMVVSH